MGHMCEDNEAPLTRKVAVTGAQGYLGRLVCKRLSEDGYSVVGVDRHVSDFSIPGVSWRTADARVVSEIENALEDVGSIVNCIAAVPLARAKTSLWASNFDASKSLVRAADSLEIRRVVHLSSSAIYGTPEKIPISESVPPEPLEEYGRSKLAGEKAWSESRVDRTVAIMRPRTIVGEGRRGIFGLLFQWIREGKPVPVAGNGSNLYDFVHVSDVVNGIVSALSVGANGIFNLGSRETSTMAANLEHVIESAESSSEIRSVPNNLLRSLGRLSDVLPGIPFAPYHFLAFGANLTFDNWLARRELGYSPAFSSREALLESYLSVERGAKLAGGTTPHTRDFAGFVGAAANQILRLTRKLEKG